MEPCSLSLSEEFGEPAKLGQPSVRSLAYRRHACIYQGGLPTQGQPCTSQNICSPGEVAEFILPSVRMLDLSYTQMLTVIVLTVVTAGVFIGWGGDAEFPFAPRLRNTARGAWPNYMLTSWNVHGKAIILVRFSHLPLPGKRRSAVCTSLWRARACQYL